MSKTLETKKRILDLLKKREMTVSGLSKELGLSAATISQHMDELQSMGAVEKVNNEYFKKLKYYRTKEIVNPVIAKYIAMVVVVLVVASAVYFYRGGILSTTPRPTSTVSAVSPGGVESFACPMIFYQLNGSIADYKGFSLYYLNYMNGTIADYVMANGASGNLYATESMGNVLQEPANSTVTERQHYAILTQEEGTGFNTSSEGLNISISPENFTVTNNSKLNFTVTIVTDSAAPNMTYLLRIDGPCGGGVTPVLLTVGNMPYNGTIEENAGIYG